MEFLLWAFFPTSFFSSLCFKFSQNIYVTFFNNKSDKIFVSFLVLRVVINSIQSPQWVFSDTFLLVVAVLEVFKQVSFPYHL